MSLQALIGAAVSTAFEALGDLVQTGLLRRATLGAYDTTTGEPGGTDVEEYAVSLVVTGEAQQDRDTAGSGTAAGRGLGVVTKALVKPHTAVEPLQGDHLVIAGIEYRVESVLATNPGGTPLLYELGVVR